MLELTLNEMQNVGGAGGKIDPGGYGDFVPSGNDAVDDATQLPAKASPKLFL